MKEKPNLVSIIIPLYNAERYIAQTLDSVCEQTYANWEVLIVDDCSTDDGVEVVSRYVCKDNRFKLYSTEDNFGGPARPRNIGLENAQGDFIAFLDADDLWDKDKLKHQVSYMVSHSNINLLCGNTGFIDCDSNMIMLKKYFCKEWIKKIIRKPIFVTFRNYINTGTVMLRSNSFPGFRFDEDVNLIAVEDWGFWLNCIKDVSFSSIHYDPLCVMYYRVYGESISNRDPIQYNNSCSYLLEKFYNQGDINTVQYLLGRLGRVL